MLCVLRCRVLNDLLSRYCSLMMQRVHTNEMKSGRALQGLCI